MEVFLACGSIYACCVNVNKINIVYNKIKLYVNEKGKLILCEYAFLVVALPVG